MLDTKLSSVCSEASLGATGLSTQKSRYVYELLPKSRCGSLPLTVSSKAIIPTATGAILEQVWVGRHANDLIRPNGDVAVKATGKDFQCHVLMVFQIDDNGQFTRIDEYYNKHWEDGVRDQDYLVMKGASMKSKV